MQPEQLGGSPELPPWRALPLTGHSLIEASAGTGKTYNITLLHLRLLLERGLGIRQILVTTFTDAAAAELKARIRQRLLQVARRLAGWLPAAAASASESAQEPLDDADLERWLALHREDAAAWHARLQLALAEIDLAPISTIHGYCRRVLRDYPLEAGMPFELGEVADEKQLRAELIRDYWRQRFLRSEVDPWERGFVLPLGPDSFASRVGEILDRPDARMLIEPTRELRERWRRFVAADRSALQRTLDRSDDFSPRGSSKHYKALLSLQAAAHANDPRLADWVELHQRFSAENIDNGWRKGSNTTRFSARPELRPVIELSQLAFALAERIRNDCALAAADFVRERLSQTLQARGLSTFRQMIDAVSERLCDPAGAALADCLRAEHPAALIDEFQDTDQRQWRIFERLYLQAEPAALPVPAGVPPCLVLIGDPKQSIYAFRGGDLHAYLNARERIPPQRRFRISRNYRSTPALLQTLNALYALAGEHAFGMQAIEYVPISAGRPEAIGPHPALSLRLLDPPPDPPKGRKGDQLGKRDDLALPACANDIAGLLASGQARAGDIAVLLRRNKDIARLRELLTERGVAVVSSSRDEVLETEWAEQIQLLLYALLHPNDERAIRGALATRLLGADSRRLEQLLTQAAEWERELERFGLWLQLWQRRGVLALIENIAQEQAARLLRDGDGERAMTDLRHLAEVLQAAASECYGPAELYAWLAQARNNDSSSGEAARERQLRIESEAHRVRLLTLHASKGLEFPIVFLPMLWRNIHEYRGLPRFHDPEHRLCLDLGSRDQAAHLAQAKGEDQQERMRLLYVGLTRARRRVVLTAFKDLPARYTPPSADDEHSLLQAEAAVLLGAAMHSVPGAPDWSSLSEAIPALAIDAGTDVYRRVEPARSRSPQRHAREPLPLPRPPFGLYSFTALTRFAPTVDQDNRRAEDEPTAADDPAAAELGLTAEAELARQAPQPHPQLQALAELKGPAFGNALHRLLEDGPGARPFLQQPERIAAVLSSEGWILPEETARSSLQAVGGLLDRCLSSDLGDGLRLAHLRPRQRRAEFEFSFPLAQARWGQLGRLLASHGLADWWPGDDSGQRLRGMMKGYIDLVFEWQGRFHVLDYKSNWLGNTLADYQPTALDRAMRAHHYGLQALIYSVALHRYLAGRIERYAPEQHLGPACYLFIRAVGLREPGSPASASAAGIWRMQFPSALIEALDQLLDPWERAA
jgi:exodeoxyribonuclease V beta subunit